MNSPSETELSAMPSAAKKKPNTVRVVLLLVLLAIAAFYYLNQTTGFSLSGKPSEASGRIALEARIAKQSQGNIRLVSFSKTNGRDGEIFGRKVYEMDYEAEIEFGQDGSWLKGDPMSGLGYGFTRERYGGNALAQFAASIDGAVPVRSGDRQKVSGKLLFGKSERGWQTED